jgi:hypothetical protein
MLTDYDATAAPTNTKVTAEQGPFLEYHLETNVNEFAALNLDERSIMAHPATGDEEGLAEVQKVYSNGSVLNDTKFHE